ncbi:Zn-ribbon domain-containing OB-fold protein [Microbacterium rhizophilus]|uniref:Zn-ribbon domain-containing OB-fold protein n=1 Tax=Microbacterium rhizophilus TaxID=3138934 RepID=UPI0031E5A195
MSTTGYLPDVDDPLTAPFWAAAREHRLVAQRCVNGHFRWTPSELCPDCLAPEATWEPLRGEATVWSLAVYHRAMHPAFAGRVPYTVAMLELPEGIRMLGTIETSTGDADRDGEVRIGDIVTATFDAVTDDVTLVRWRAGVE